MEIIKEQPMFSIVTVTYNCCNSIRETIESVLNQTYRNYEYLIIDGQSSDGTLNVIKEYNDPRTSYTSEKDTGIYDAMNKGILKASGRWLLFLNSGDVFTDNQVLEKVEIHAKNGMYDILYGDIFVNKKKIWEIKKAAEPCNKQRMFFCHQSSFTRTEIMKSQLFDSSYSMSADLLFFKQCYYKGLKFYHIPIPIVKYDSNGISNTNRIAGLKENIDIIKAVDKFPFKYLFLARLQFVIFRIQLSNVLKTLFR